MIDSWTRENLAYLAGLLEGEGSFIFNAQNRLIVQLQMTDEDVVKRAVEISGMGKVNGPYKYVYADSIKRKSTWLWQIHNREAYAMMVALYPWMGDRRKLRIRECINSWIEFQRTKNERVYRESKRERDTNGRFLKGSS